MDLNLIIPLFMGLRGWQLIIVLVLILLLFGAKRIPTMMRSLGKGVHSFKQGIEDAKAEMNKPIDKTPEEKDKEKDKSEQES